MQTQHYPAGSGRYEFRKMASFEVIAITIQTVFFFKFYYSTVIIKITSSNFIKTKAKFI